METDKKSLAGTSILYAITKSNWGGAQSYVYELACAAQDAGAQVSVAFGSADGAVGSPGLLAERLSEAGISTIPLSRIRRNIGVVEEYKAFRELVQVIKKERPNVLHVNSSKMGLLGALAGRLSGVPRIIFTAHGWPHREPRSYIWKITIWIASWVTILFSHKVIVVSECDLKTSPVFFSRKKIVTIHNGISSFHLKTREAARTALIAHNSELSHLDTILLMNAELHANKGIDIAMHALAILAPNYPNLALVVQGEGQERVRLTRLAYSLKITKQVFLVGFVPNARENLRAAEIYLMPSRKEGLPMALLEAGLADLPVVASHTGGISEIIENGKDGLLIPPDSSGSLVQAIESLLRNPSLAQDLGISLHQKIALEFTHHRMITQTFAIY